MVTHKILPGLLPRKETINSKLPDQHYQICFNVLARMPFLEHLFFKAFLIMNSTEYVKNYLVLTLHKKMVAQRLMGRQLA